MLLAAVTAFELSAGFVVVVSGFGATLPTDLVFPAGSLPMPELKAVFTLSGFRGEWFNWNVSFSKGCDVVREALFGKSDNVNGTLVAVFLGNVVNVSQCLVRAETLQELSI